MIRNEQAYRDLLESFSDGVTIVSPDGLILDINQRPLDDAHLRREEVMGKRFTDLPAWSSDPAVQQQLQAALARASQGETVCFEARIHPRTDLYLDILMTITSHRNANQQVEYLICAGRDITERKQAEERIKASEESFRLLAEAVPQLVWTMWPDGRLEYTNQRYREVTQANLSLEGDELWRQFVHPEDIERALALRHQSLKSGSTYENEYRILDGRTGTYCWFLARALPVRDEGGQVVKWFGTTTDIDEQKRLEEALRQSQERTNALMNSNIIGVNVIEEGQFVDANNTFLRMTGYTREDLRAGHLNVMQMTAPEDRVRTQQAHQTLAYQQALTPYEKTYLCKDGSRLPVLVGGVVFQRQPRRSIGFALDNSARKELEQRKDDCINMASHELRNPLAALKIQTQLVRRRLEKHSQHEAATELSRVEGPVKQIERLITELLDVSKIQAGRLEYQQEMVDLDELLREVTETMHHLHPSHTLLLRGAVQTCLMADRERLGQVFTNLMSNAIKYSPDAQTVEIDLAASEETVTISVRDHGLGIPAEQREKIFERFYRAAGSRQSAIPGLGMGLYIVQEIIKHHGGTISVESEVGKGSAFTVTLPRKRDV